MRTTAPYQAWLVEFATRVLGLRAYEYRRRPYGLLSQKARNVIKNTRKPGAFIIWDTKIYARYVIKKRAIIRRNK